MSKGAGGILRYNPDNREKARALRNNMTEAEKRIWIFLREQKDPWLRQKPISNYIVDFYCSKYQLVVEIDGETHGTKEEIEYDTRRTDFLESL